MEIIETPDYINARNVLVFSTFNECARMVAENKTQTDKLFPQYAGNVLI